MNDYCLAIVVSLCLSICTATASEPNLTNSDKTLRLAAKVLASNICNKLIGSDQFVYEETEKLVTDHIFQYEIFGEGVEPSDTQTIEFLNKYKNDLFCVDHTGDLINYMAFSVKKRKNHGLFDLYLLD